MNSQDELRAYVEKRLKVYDAEYIYLRDEICKRPNQESSTLQQVMLLHIVGARIEELALIEQMLAK
jgi:hypothetical protein